MPFTEAAFPFYAHDGLYHAHERPISDLSDSSSLAELLNTGLSANKETGAEPVSLFYTGISVQSSGMRMFQAYWQSQDCAARVLFGICKH